MRGVRRLMRCVSVEQDPDPKRRGAWCALLVHPDAGPVLLRSTNRDRYVVGTEYWVTFRPVVESVEPMATKAA